MYSLVLKTVDKEGRAYGGFQYPKTGMVEAPDWKDTKECGNGLHGALWEEGNGSLFNWDEDAVWIVLKAETSNIIDLNGKVKFPKGEVVFYGSKEEATEYIKENGKGIAIIGGTSIVGDYGTATTGDGGKSFAGYNGTATTGNYGKSFAGYKGTAITGNYGTASAGIDGIIQITYWDSINNRYRIKIGYIGEDGLKPNTKYKLDNNHNFIEVSKA